MDLSIVTTVYKSQDYLNDFYHRISKSAQEIGINYEVVFIDDGSPDNSANIIKKLALKDSKVRLIELSRNFGHHPAILTGLSQARGNLVFLIDCDLEEPPELLGAFKKKLDESRCDVVYGVQEQRKGNFFEKMFGKIFYKIINAVSEVKVPEDLLTARLMTREYIDALLLFSERVVFLGGIWSAVGFNQVPYTVRKGSRGISSYSLSKKIKLAVDSITSFSEKPLMYVFNLGTAISGLSFFYLAYIVFERLVFHTAVRGWSSVIASIWLFGGLTLASIGIVGMYVARIFVETKSRPRSIVKNARESSINSDEKNFEKELSTHE